jgi:hypothetical protein
MGNVQDRANHHNGQSKLKHISSCSVCREENLLYARDNAKAGHEKQATSLKGLFAAGDQPGVSRLVGRVINEGQGSVHPALACAAVRP